MSYSQLLILAMAFTFGAHPLLKYDFDVLALTFLCIGTALLIVGVKYFILDLIKPRK